MTKNKNKVRRYRLNDFTANKLGLVVNKSQRYRLDKLQEAKLLSFKPAGIKRLFFDIETSPNIVYAWRIGYKINLDPSTIIQERKIICIGYKWEGEDEVKILKWDENMDDKAMLEEFIKVADKADEIIGHNGDRFDMKWLRTRCIYHRIPMMPTYKTLDTLKKARSGFNFNSNRLDYIAQFLGVGAKIKHSGFDMWKKVMANDQEAMKEMCDYCVGDIVVLEDVYKAMQSYITPNTNAGAINGNAKYSCPTCSTEKVSLYKNTFTARGTISRIMECDCCGMKYPISNSAYRVFMMDIQAWNVN